MLSKKQLLAMFIIVIFTFSMNDIKVEGYVSEITISNAKVMIDKSRGIHIKFENFEGNLTLAGNVVDINNDTITDLESVSGLFLSQLNSGYSTAEMNIIRDFLHLGNRTLFVTGDSDYGGYYSPNYVNDLLYFLGSSLRIGADSMHDSVDKLGAYYRLLATEYGNSSIANITKIGCNNGIYLHAPTSVLGFNGTDIIDLRKENLPNVEVLVSYDENATSVDMDLSNTVYDFYANSTETGYYPAVVCEKVSIGDNESYIIVAGEVIFSDYKHMYDQFTDVLTENYGQMFVNNLVNYFLVNATILPVVNEFQQTIILALISSATFILLMMNIKRKRSKL